MEPLKFWCGRGAIEHLVIPLCILLLESRSLLSSVSYRMTDCGSQETNLGNCWSSRCGVDFEDGWQKFGSSRRRTAHKPHRAITPSRSNKEIQPVICFQIRITGGGVMLSRTPVGANPIPSLGVGRGNAEIVTRSKPFYLQHPLFTRVLEKIECYFRVTYYTLMGDKNGFELSQAQKRRSEDGEHEDGRRRAPPSRMRACMS
jgi:hypothetical protein